MVSTSHVHTVHMYPNVLIWKRRYLRTHLHVWTKFIYKFIKCLIYLLCLNFLPQGLLHFWLLASMTLIVCFLRLLRARRRRYVNEIPSSGWLYTRVVPVTAYYHARKRIHENVSISSVFGYMLLKSILCTLLSWKSFVLK